MSINPFNKVLVTGGYDGDIILFHPTMKNPIMSFKGHSEPIVSVESSPTHHDYASGSQDGLIRIWDYRFFAACTKTINCSPTQQIPLYNILFIFYNSIINIE
jgi:WD40 repeat protein